MLRSTGWCFTWNNPQLIPADVIDILDGLVDDGNVLYWIFQVESAPETGTIHFQGYLHLSRQQRLSFVKTRFASQPHFSIARGSPQENKNYCSKDESRCEGDAGPWEGGDITHCGQGTRSDLIAYIDSIKQGATDMQLLEQHPKEFVRYSKARLDIRSTMVERRVDPPLVILYTGPSGCGKTRRAVEWATTRNKNYYLRTGMGEWFQNYQGQEVCILDEVDKYRDSGFSFNLFLRILDRYDVDVPIKGGSFPFASKTIILTAVQQPEHWYDGLTNSTEQIGRRITEWWACEMGQWVNRTNWLYRPVKEERVEPNIVCIDLSDSE